MEKNVKKNVYMCYVYIYMFIYTHTYLNHCAVHRKLEQYCKSTILQLKKNQDRIIFNINYIND